MTARAVAYIPAKGRSRGLPRKNLALLDDVPLVGHSIRFAKDSGMFSTVFVSTESAEVAELARSLGASVLDRPPELSGDDVRVADVLVHELAAIQKQGAADILACLLPTSPLRRLADLKQAFALADRNPAAPSIVSLGALPCGLGQIVALEAGTSRVQPLYDPANLTTLSQRQSHDALFYPNGSIVLVRLAHFTQDPRFYVAGESVGFIIDAISGLDIDSRDDLELAQIILRGMRLPSKSA